MCVIVRVSPYVFLRSDDCLWLNQDVWYRMSASLGVGVEGEPQYHMQR